MKEFLNIRFINARILTMEEELGKDGNLREIIEGELHVSGSKISYVGKALTDDELKSMGIGTSFDFCIDCEGNLLMPGFKDAHTHSAMTAMRSYADGLPLQEWLETKIFPMEAKMTGEDVKLLTKLAIMEYVTSGVTAIMDMYLDPYAIHEACVECGMRVAQVSGINKFGPSLEEFEKRYLEINGKSPISTQMMGFHAEYTCDLELLKSIAAIANKYKAPVFAHISETKSEVDGCIERYGMTPTELFESIGMFEYGGGGYHCVYFTDNDIEIFKKHNMTVVFNIGSNIKLASGMAPIHKYMDKGLNLAIGTDGPSSNNCLDMFREMFLVSGLAKLGAKDAAAGDALDVLKMATVGGAKAMGLEDCDVLAKDKEADIIMIDLHQPNMQPLNDIARNIVYSGSKSNVKMTMVHGKILYLDGEYHLGIDEDEIYKKANETIKRLKESV